MNRKGGRYAAPFFILVSELNPENGAGLNVLPDFFQVVLAVQDTHNTENPISLNKTSNLEFRKTKMPRFCGAFYQVC